KRFLLRCLSGGGVLRDVALRMRSNPDFVPTNRHGVEPCGALVCATRNSSAGADDSTPGKFDVSGANGAAARSIIAAVSQRTTAAIAAVGLSYCNYQPQQQAGNGVAGLGWSLSDLPLIVRYPENLAQASVRGGIVYEVTNGFCLHGQRCI